MSNLVKVIKLIIDPQSENPEVDVSERPEIRGTTKGLWVEPGVLISLINGWVIAAWAVQVGYVLRPRLKPKNGVGAKVTYSDESILLTVIVMRVWRKGYESFSGWLSRNPTLAHSLGYTAYDQGGRLKTISASQLSRRHRQLGYVPYVLFFIALVWQLIRLGAINGRDLIIDSSLLQAWYHHDPEANYSYRSRWKGAVFGYKIHTIVCRHLVLPVFFWVTQPAAVTRFGPSLCWRLRPLCMALPSALCGLTRPTLAGKSWPSFASSLGPVRLLITTSVAKTSNLSLWISSSLGRA